MGYVLDVAFHAIRDYFVHIIFPRFVDFIRVPYDNKDVLWALVPLFVTLFFIQLYFGRHRHEEIGWNSAYANSIVLIFVSANLIQYLIRRYSVDVVLQVGSEAFYKGILVLVIILLAANLFFIDFFHAVSKRVSFFLSSSIFITFVSYIAIVGVYSYVAFDYHTIVVGVLTFFILWVFFKLFRSIVPPSPVAKRILNIEKQKRRHQLLIKERKIKQEIYALKEKIEDGWHHLRNDMKEKVD